MARGEVTGKKPTQTADQTKRLPGPPSADAAAIEPTVKSEPDAPTKAKAASRLVFDQRFLRGTSHLAGDVLQAQSG